jgi:hypothetical protein
MCRDGAAIPGERLGMSAIRDMEGARARFRVRDGKRHGLERDFVRRPSEPEVHGS